MQPVFPQGQKNTTALSRLKYTFSLPLTSFPVPIGPTGSTLSSLANFLFKEFKRKIGKGISQSLFKLRPAVYKS